MQYIILLKTGLLVNAIQEFAWLAMAYEPIRAWTNDKYLATKHHQTLFDNQTFYLLDAFFGAF